MQIDRFRLRSHWMLWKQRSVMAARWIAHLFAKESASTLLFGAVWFGVLAFALPYFAWLLMWLVPIAQWVLGAWATVLLVVGLVKLGRC